MTVSPNARNWLNAISAAEGTTRNGKVQYNIMFGGGTFNDLSKHPDTVIDSGRYRSAAAGAYQFMSATYRGVARDLNLQDFSPESQDQAALELIRRRGVDPDRDPITRENVAKLAPEWAALPTLSGKSFYNQPVKSFEFVSRAGGNPYLTPQEAAPSKPPEPVQVAQSPAGESKTAKTGQELPSQGFTEQELVLLKMATKLLESQNQLGGASEGQVVSLNFPQPEASTADQIASRLVEYLKSKESEEPKNPYSIFAQDPLKNMNALVAQSSRIASNFRPGRSVI